MDMSRRGFIQSAVATAGVAGLTAQAQEKPLSAYRRGALGKIVGELPPGRYDAHMHVFESGVAEPKPEEFWKEMQRQGMSGGCLFSTSPNVRPFGQPPLIPDPEKAMDNVIAWCSASPTLYPFYWIDPGAPNALELVDMAVEKGIFGFKVIRSNGMPCDEKTLPVYAKIADANRPLTFHTGILFDGMPSSQYFRPVNFEPLLDVAKLRFAMAHVSWPWHDECVALYGKIRCTNDLYRPGKTPKMFIDTTVGSPNHYRKAVLSAVYSVYDVTDRVMFGTDHFVAHYDQDGWTKKQMALDDGILAELGKSAAVADSYYRRALQQFLFG